MKYTQFVKANYAKVSHLPVKERMVELGRMWREGGHANKKVTLKGKKLVVGEEGGMFIKRKGGKRGRKAVSKSRGKGLLSDTLGALGLGMDEKSVQGGKYSLDPRKQQVEGQGIISDTLGALGLGMKKRGRKPKGGSMSQEFHKLMPSQTQMGAVGLGMKKRGRKAKGGNVGGNVGGQVVGGLFDSGLLASIGLGMPDKVKQKHLNKMVALQKQLHSKGKLTPVQNNKLKVYHTLHGQGFFDSLFSGIKKGVGAVVGAIPTAINTVGQITKVVPEIAKVVPGVGQMAAPLLGAAARLAPLAMVL
jgi:hypothetical protein